LSPKLKEYVIGIVGLVNEETSGSVGYSAT
jgi:hypothetical protein